MATQVSNRSFPSFNIPDKKKKDKWHKQVVQAIAGQALDDSYVNNQAAMDLNYRYYNGDTLSDEYSFVQEAEDGEVFPAVWNNMNRIKSRMGS